MKKSDLLLYRDFHWKYFCLHAEQRLKTFNFFIIVSAVFIGAYINMLVSSEENILLVILPFIISYIAFVFWKLDIRTRSMIKNAEKRIKHIDDQILKKNGGKNSEMNIFRYDDFMQSQKKELSYSNCFHLLFLLVGLLGVFSSSFFLLKLYVCS